MLENCKKADVFEKSGNPLCRARVSVGPTGGILLIFPRTVKYKTNLPYRVVFYDPTLGILTCRCRLSVALPLPGGQLCSLRCEIQEKISQEQRRQDVKIPLEAGVKLFTTFITGDPVRVTDDGFPAIVVNISAGGVYLRTALPLPKGRRVWFKFPPLDGITLNAQILRVENATVQVGQTQYGYGCKFLNLTTKHEALLRSYIFQEERRQRQAAENANP